MRTYDHRGEKHPRHRLTDKDIFDIRSSWSKGEVQRDIAARYHITQGWVSKICSGIGWGHLVT